jgi:hypothetical protein
MVLSPIIAAIAILTYSSIDRINNDPLLEGICQRICWQKRPALGSVRSRDRAKSICLMLRIRSRKRTGGNRASVSEPIEHQAEFIAADGLVRGHLPTLH